MQSPNEPRRSRRKQYFARGWRTTVALADCSGPSGPRGAGCACPGGVERAQSRVMPAAFDTLEVSKRLKSVGFDDAQAEAITGVLRDSREADLSKLATKDDLTHEIARLETTLRAEM